MSNRDDVLAALDGEVPKGRTQLAEECGLDPQQVSVELTALHNAGLASRGPDGWIKLTDPAPHVDKPPRRIHAKKRRGRPPKTETETPARATKPAKRATKRRKNAPLKRFTLTESSGGQFTYALTDCREILIRRRDGKGEPGIMGAKDALRLAAFVEFVRPALEAKS